MIFKGSVSQTFDNWKTLFLEHWWHVLLADPRTRSGLQARSLHNGLEQLRPPIQTILDGTSLSPFGNHCSKEMLTFIGYKVKQLSSLAKVSQEKLLFSREGCKQKNGLKQKKNTSW